MDTEWQSYDYGDFLSIEKWVNTGTGFKLVLRYVVSQLEA